MKATLCNGGTLAYIGDAYYELLVREELIEKGFTKVNDLHKNAIRYTSGQQQAKIIELFLKENILSEEEINYYKKGRNIHTNQNRRNISVEDYQRATGFEALIGYLYLENNMERLDFLFQKIVQILA